MKPGTTEWEGTLNCRGFTSQGGFQKDNSRSRTCTTIEPASAGGSGKAVPSARSSSRGWADIRIQHSVKKVYLARGTINDNEYANASTQSEQRLTAGGCNWSVFRRRQPTV